MQEEENYRNSLIRVGIQMKTASFLQTWKWMNAQFIGQKVPIEVDDQDQSFSLKKNADILFVTN